MELVELIYRFTERFPKTEQFGVVTQMRRAAVSVPANIAEGAARQSVKETLQFYFVARGSLSELDALVELSRRLEFSNKDENTALTEKMSEVSSLLQGLIAHNQRQSR